MRAIHALPKRVTGLLSGQLRRRSQSMGSRWSQEASSVNDAADYHHHRRGTPTTIHYSEPDEGKASSAVRAGLDPEPASSSTPQRPAGTEINGLTAGANQEPQAQERAAPAAAMEPPVVNKAKVTQSFYRRPLPTTHCVAFSSPEGRRLFQEALHQGGMDSFFPLSEQFKTQDDPAFCGLGALTMVLNALAIDPGRTWKGPWRWFDESMLECCEPLEVVRAKGICISKLNCLAQCNGATTRLKYGDVTSVDAFREDIIRTTHHHSNQGELMIVGYNRKVLGQTGTGHFSPVGGYHRDNDVALIMDVARFKYPPHWVPVPLLYEAMQTPDPETGRSRGYMLVAKGMVSESLLFTIDRARYMEWEALADWLRSAAGEMRQLLHRHGESSSLDHASMLPSFLSSLPPSIASLVTTYHEALCLNYSDVHQSSINTLISAIEDHPIYDALGGHETLLCQFRDGWSGCCARKVLNERHLLTMMYVSMVEWVSGRSGPSLFPSASHPLLQLEVAQLKRKFDAMADQQQ